MSDSTVLAELSDQLAAAVEKAARSTVLVSARRRFPASGIAWSGDGIIVTADHVLEREEEIHVVDGNGNEFGASIAGRDPGSDIAVLRVSGASFIAAEHAPEASVKVGSLVLAVARLSTEGPMASFGIVSAISGPWRTRGGHSLSSYLRSDTTFYPGFSGGPLVDVLGRVVGINSSSLGRGAGLTVPLSAASGVINDLIAGGRVRRAYLGVSSQVVPLPSTLAKAVGDQTTGLLVVMVEPGSPADAAGLLVGDILVRVENTALTDTESLQAELLPERIGKALQLTILRGGTPHDLALTPGQRA